MKSWRANKTRLKRHVPLHAFVVPARVIAARHRPRLDGAGGESTSPSHVPCMSLLQSSVYYS